MKLFAIFLAMITVVYNVFEGLFSIYFGLNDETLVLFGFGLDSFVEVFSGLGILYMIMKMKGIACSTGSACSSASLEPSHVIKALGRDTELAHSAIRFSLGRFNTGAEIDTAISLINRVVKDLKEKKLHRSRVHADSFE